MFEGFKKKLNQRLAIEKQGTQQVVDGLTAPRGHRKFKQPPRPTI